MQSVGWAEVGSQDPQEALNALNADSGHLAAFLSWGHPGYADTNLEAKAKRAVLFGQLGEVAQVGSAPRSLTQPLQRLEAFLLWRLSEAVKAGPVSRPLTPPQSQG